MEVEYVVLKESKLEVEKINAGLQERGPYAYRYLVSDSLAMKIYFSTNTYSTHIQLPSLGTSFV